LLTSETSHKIWNIIALQRLENAVMLCKNLCESAPKIHALLETLEQEMIEAARSIQTRIDQSAAAMYDWINDGMEEACGWVVYNV
jgi:hypothetical protein